MPVVEHQEFVLKDLSPAHDGLKIGQLTDIHVGRATPRTRIQKAIHLVNAFEPDLVVLTGDYLSHEPRGIFLLQEQLAGLTAPALAVLGNHDHWVDARGTTKALLSLGYHVLRNQNTTFRLHNEPFTVVGLDDLATGNTDLQQAFKGAQGGSRLVLAHVPRTADYLTSFRASLCLTGHTHGGHVNIPGITSILMRQLRERYLAGHYHLPHTQLYVSRGIGGAVFPFRFNAPPEVTLLTLRSAHPDYKRVA
jgi:hypothetical protein